VILSGRILTAEEAAAAGLVELVDDPFESAAAAAERLLKAGPEAQAIARAVVEETLSLDLDEALAHASESWLTLMGSDQRVEGHTAFLEKRPPGWEQFG
jgi:enoyl-CoA hydratase